ncbi:glycerophosphodiester phosphodiesterase [Gilvimarinus sp. DA14]|uniref:glycerophosphodiester phosphodiesterase n=1 Tax=Gilvimarinus sp. DA14 TaxID=2956798 RepID=UPI0020B8D448|nr:glycerophosphodiester phosphodiesterase [Gilvimarinus sp. DA14]UTF59805.1 glycerophosphodiester phosphodiesterase [Gilvimarinus sp. DA14]
MLCIAHRGHTGPGRPENSLAAVKAALELGVEGIEIDLWYFHGRFWMTHDRHWQGAQQSLQALSRGDLEAIRQSNGEPLADLDELLSLVQDKCLLNIELKNAGGADLLSKTLTAFGRNNGVKLEHIIISSFNHHELAECRRHLPHIKLGVLLASLPLSYAACAEPLQPYSVNTSINLLSRELTQDIHRRGYQHWVYTANTEEDWRQLEALGVDGCFTDKAAQLRKYLNAKSL